MMRYISPAMAIKFWDTWCEYGLGKKYKLPESECVYHGDIDGIPDPMDHPAYSIQELMLWIPKKIIDKEEKELALTIEFGYDNNTIRAMYNHYCLSGMLLVSIGKELPDILMDLILRGIRGGYKEFYDFQSN